jgi:hypothetical protein
MFPKLHPDAVAILLEDGTQIGWQFKNENFTYQAFQRPNQVKVYIVWTDDQPEDNTWFIDWEGAERYLKLLME